MAYRTIRPDADYIDGGWRNESEGENLFDSVNDSPTVDSDYIISSPEPAQDVVKVAMENPATGLTSPAELRYRLKRRGTLLPVDATVSLMQDDAIVGSWYHTDENWETVLLIHMDGADASTTFNDETGRHVVTAGGNAQVDTAQSKFGGAAALFDGTTDRLIVSKSEDFAFGLGDFTIECWVRLSVVDVYQGIFFASQTSGKGAGIGINNSNNVIYSTWSANFIFSTTMLSVNTWYHVAVTRANGVSRLFINGTQEGGNYSDSNDWVAYQDAIVGDSPDQTVSLNGWIDELRVVKGRAMWTAAFTPPTLQYELPEPVTALLLHMDGADAATTFADATERHVVTANGNAQVDTAQSKFGGAAALFDGTGDSLNLDGSNDFNFGIGDFTVDFWLRISDLLGGGQFTPMISGSGGSNRWQITIFTDNLWFATADGSGILTTASVGFAINTWYHIAVTRAAGVIKLFLNGVEKDSDANTTDWGVDANYPLIGSGASGTNALNGHIDELRVIKGHAVWTQSFSPPQAPYNLGYLTRLRDQWWTYSGKLTADQVAAITTPNNLFLQINARERWWLDDAAVDMDFAEGRYYVREEFYGPELVLHMDGTDTSTTFPDAGGGHTVTANGNAQVDTAQSKFGGASLLCDGTGDFVAVTANLDRLSLSGDFTIDFWTRLNTTDGANFFNYDNAGTTGPTIAYSVGGPLNVYLGGQIILGTTNLTTGSWHHVALTRSGGYWRLFLNGTQEGSTYFNASTMTVTTSVAIGARQDGNFCLNGWMDEVRVYPTKALWTANFTPPSAEWDVGDDAHYPYHLLLHFDGDDGSRRIVDSAGRHALGFLTTPSRILELDTAQSKFGGSSLKLNGGYLFLDGSSDFAFGTGDFTIDCWIRRAAGGWHVIFDSVVPGSMGAPRIWIENSSDKINVSGFGAATLTTTTVLSVDTWYHFALTRGGGTLRLFLDGVLEDSTSSTNDLSTFAERPVIGAFGEQLENAYGNFWLDEYRIIKGKAIWTGNFTPPTARYEVSHARPVYTHLLLHMSGPDGGTTFNDATGRHVVTANGNAQVDDAQFKFGATSAKFDGTGDYLSCDGSSDFAFGTGDFTVDFWIRFNSVGVNQLIYDGRPSGSEGLYPTIYITSGAALTYFTNSADRINGPTLSTATWYHVALARFNGSTKLFVNGVQGGSTYTDANDYVNAANRPFVGASGSVGPGSNGVDGWIDEVRVIKGRAVWTSDFVPPTKPWDVTSPLLNDLISESRASTAYAKTPYAALVNYPNNQPRINGLGLNVEDARTNIVLHSEDFSNAAWNNNNLTVTVNQAVAPNGATTMDKLDDATATATHNIHQGRTIVDTLTASYFVKDVDRRYVYVSAAFEDVSCGFVVCDLQNGGAVTSTGTNGGATLNGYGVEPYPNGIYRIWCAVTKTGQTIGYPVFGLSDTPTPAVNGGNYSYTGTNKSIYAWGAQGESGVQFPSSYIPTTTTSAARASESITFIGNLDSALSGSARSLVMDLRIYHLPSDYSHLLRADPGGGATAVLQILNGDIVISNTRTVSSLDFTLGNSMHLVTGAKIGCSWNAAGRSSVGGGGTVATDANGWTADESIKIESQAPITGQYYRRIVAWNSRLPDAKLKQLTAP